MLKLAARIGVISVFGSFTVALAQNWAAPVNGFWSESAKWSPQAVPGAGAAVLLPFSSAYTVTQYGSVSIDSLDISNPLAQLLVANSALLSLNSATPVSGIGSVKIQSDGSNNSTGLRFMVGGSLSGGGAVVLYASNGWNAYVEAVAGSTVEQAAGRTLQGRGRIYGNWINNGLIQADVPGVLQFMTANAQIDNNNIMQAINSGSLQFNSQTVTQSFAGRLTASSGSSLYLSGTTLSGGSVESLNGGYVQAYGTWSNVAPFGPFTIQPSQLLTIASAGLAHHDTITIQSDGSSAATGMTFTFGGTLSGNGTIYLNALGAQYKAFVEAVSGTTVTNGVGRTIRGRGYLHGNWVNDGIVRADLLGAISFVTANAQITNNNVVEAISSGAAGFGSQTVNQSNSGRLIANSGSSLYLSGTTLSGGSVESLNGGYVQAYGTWSNVAPFGPFTIQPSQALTIATAGLTHENTITIQSDGSDNATGLTFTNGGSLSGGGTLLLNALGHTYKAYVVSAGGTTLTNESGRTVRGRGYLHGNWINNGLVQADLPGALVFTTANAQIGNTSIMQAINSGSLQFNSQTVTQSSSGRLVANSGSSLYLSGTTLAGGTVEALNGGYVQVYGTWSDVAPFGPFIIQPSQQLTVATPGLAHEDTITIQSDGSDNSTGLRFLASGTLGGNGTVLLNALGHIHKAYLEATSGTTITHSAGRTLRGRGNLYGNWINQGTISPGLTTGSVGTISVLGPMTFGATSALVFDVLGGAGGQFDSLPGNSPLTLNGSISVKINGWNPTTLCSSINLITASSISGKFSSYVLDTPTPPAGMVWRLNYQPTRVALALTCRPDLTGDCQVDDADFTIFAESYNILDCADPTMPQYCPADINQDGVVDDADFSLFAVAYDDLICS